LIRRYLPEDLVTHIYVDEQPVDAGNYVAGAVTLSREDVNTEGFAFFKIAPRTAGVRQYWSQELPASMTAQAAQNFDCSAKVEVDDVVLQNPVINYTYKQVDSLFGGLFESSTTERPTEPGRYLQTAVVAGNYAADNISRTITIGEPALLG